jgi:glycosyltransferase involved in cell wall biosynthesis
MPDHAPLRVCLVLDSVKEDAGTERLVAALATRLDRGLFEPHVCCFEDSERLTSLSRHLRTVVFPVGRVYSPAGLRWIWRFRRYIERNQIDVVHSFMTRADIFGVLAALYLRRPVVITSRLNSGYWYTPGYIRLFRFLNRHTAHVVTNSAYAKKVVAAAEKLAPDKITVLYTGVDLARYSSSSGDLSVAVTLGVPSDAQVVGVVANYRPVKDLALFLKSAHIVAAAAPRAAFLLVGKGELRPELEKLAVELRIRDRVFFSDGRGSVPDHLARMSVACLSSLSEGLPNAILEYMAAGLPVVATDVGGNSELVADGVTGYLVRGRTPEAFAEPIIRLLRDEALRAAMGQKGLERARTEFDLSAAVQRLESFYISAVENARVDAGAQRLGAIHVSAGHR